MIKVLCVDDSALMRKLLEQALLQEGDFDVRLARNAAEAFEEIRAFDPQVVTLDVQMPDMDGLACLSRIMLETPRPVVMISALTADGAEATLQAMELGAVDFIAKPGRAVSLEMDRLRPVLVDKIRAASTARIRSSLRLTERIRHQLGGLPPRVRRPRPRGSESPAAAPTEPGLVLIGTSTGGPIALDVVLPQLPAELPWPVLVAQHMPANFTGPFAERLDRQCALRVVEVRRPMPLQPGRVYIGRGDADLVVARRSAGLAAMCVPAQKEYPWHPSVQRMVDSALEHYPANRLVAVLLTGMGYDGAEAMARLRAAGGHTIAEAESTAVVWGMPGELVKRGGAALVRPIEEIADAIITGIERHAVRKI